MLCAHYHYQKWLTAGLQIYYILFCSDFTGTYNWLMPAPPKVHYVSLLLLLLLCCIALVAQRPIVIKLSRGRSVGPYIRTCFGRSVGLSSALWKNGRSDPDAIVGRTGLGMRHVVRFGDRSTEGLLLGQIWGALL